jgi:hypothetical protein
MFFIPAFHGLQRTAWPLQPTSFFAEEKLPKLKENYLKMLHCVLSLFTAAKCGVCIPMQSDAVHRLVNTLCWICREGRIW